MISHIYIRPMIDDTPSCDDPTVALLHAAKHGHPWAARRALRSGASVSHADALGNTALHWAAKRGHIDIVKLLLRAGASVTSCPRRDTPLDSALAAGQVEVAALLSRIATSRNAEPSPMANRRDPDTPPHR